MYSYALLDEIDLITENPASADLKHNIGPFFPEVVTTVRICGHPYFYKYILLNLADGTVSKNQSADFIAKIEKFLKIYEMQSNFKPKDQIRQILDRI